jgi:hypothetical protein
MNAGIAATLREKLFDHPDPPRREVEFAALAMEMFPARAQFLAFLDERHFEEQVEAAKHILLRLAYQSRVSPPNKFLYNLVDTESRLAGSAAKAAFNGRDHFVHLVNLYLLGLYVFWYHPQTHKRVRDQFHELTVNQEDRSQQEKNISAFRSFLVAWREFVLFHDLGYPWEVSLGMERPSTFLAPFGDLVRYAAKDSALFAISQLLALEWLRREEPPVFLENELRTYLGSANSRQATMFGSPDQVRNLWGRAEKTPVTTDVGLWRLVCEIVPPEDRLSILETTAEGRPVASTNLDLHRLFSGGRGALDEELTDPEKLARWADGKWVSTRLRSNYQWVHYTRNYRQHLLSFSKQLFPADTLAQSAFPSFLLEFLDQFPPLTSLSEDLRFDDYAYSMFHRLLEFMDFDTFDQKEGKWLVIQDAISQAELGGLKGRLLDEVSNSLFSLLAKQSNSMDGGSEPMITSVPLEEYLRQLLSVLHNTHELADQVEERLSEQIKHRVALKGRLYKYYSLLKKDIVSRLGVPVPPVFPIVDPRAPDPKLSGIDWRSFRENCLAGELEAMLASRRLGGIATLERYRSSWAPKPQSGTVFEDHGLASGLLYAQAFQSWMAILADTKSVLGRLLNLRGTDEQDLTAASTSHSGVHEVLYSILVHNLYPNSFEAVNHKTFRTKFEKKEAFTYFAELCDSLQPWDRKRLFNQATGALPYTTYAENFNIEVDGSVLRITERGDQLKIDERQAALRGYLNSYLERASDLVKLQLSEWR